MLSQNYLYQSLSFNVFDGDREQRCLVEEHEHDCVESGLRSLRHSRNLIKCTGVLLIVGIALACFLDVGESGTVSKETAMPKIAGLVESHRSSGGIQGLLARSHVRIPDNFPRPAFIETLLNKRWKGFTDECPGYSYADCPKEYPMPFGPGKWPKTYDYKGEFPQNFVWGLGTAAYQIEGAYRDDGRGASIWDTFTGANTVGMPGGNCSYCCNKTPCPVNEGMYAKGATGNVAADHYHNHKMDVALMKSMGLRHYRFSIAWPRVIPTGKRRDGVNQKALDFYSRLIDDLLAADIVPWVTLYHWDLPQGLLNPPELQGWWSTDADGKPNGQIIQDWLDYVDVCFEAFGNRVKHWITFNEAWTFLFLGSGSGKAPGIKEFNNMTVAPWIGGHNVLMAHARAVQRYRTKFASQRGSIGITNNCDWREPASDSKADLAAAERAVLFQLGWFSDPIFGNRSDYPEPMRKLYGDRLPNFTESERRLLRGSADFFGLNHYGTAWAAFDPVNPGDDSAYAYMTHTGLPKAKSDWLYGAGWGLRKILNWIKRRYDNPVIYVTEGGWSSGEDSVPAGVSDKDRVYYYANYTTEMHKAIVEDGVDVRGYFGWSLIDNFEWERGYEERFGVTYNVFNFGRDPNGPVDDEAQPTAGHQLRQRKDSSCWLEEVWRQNAIVDPKRFRGCARFPRSASTTSGLKDLICRFKGVTDAKDAEQTSMDKFCRASNGRSPSISAFFSGGSVVTDLSANGGPARLAGFWNSAASRIEWEDGDSSIVSVRREDHDSNNGVGGDSADTDVHSAGTLAEESEHGEGDKAYADKQFPGTRAGEVEHNDENKHVRSARGNERIVKDQRSFDDKAAFGEVDKSKENKLDQIAGTSSQENEHGDVYKDAQPDEDVQPAETSSQDN